MNIHNLNPPVHTGPWQSAEPPCVLHPCWPAWPPSQQQAQGRPQPTHHHPCARHGTARDVTSRHSRARQNRARHSAPHGSGHQSKWCLQEPLECWGATINASVALFPSHPPSWVGTAGAVRPTSHCRLAGGTALMLGDKTVGVPRSLQMLPHGCWPWCLQASQHAAMLTLYCAFLSHYVILTHLDSSCCRHTLCMT